MDPDSSGYTVFIYVFLNCDIITIGDPFVRPFVSLKKSMASTLK